MCCGDISKEVITSYEFTWSEIGTKIKAFKLTKRNCISMWILIYIIGLYPITSENKKTMCNKVIEYLFTSIYNIL